MVLPIGIFHQHQRHVLGPVEQSLAGHAMDVVVPTPHAGANRDEQQLVLADRPVEVEAAQRRDEEQLQRRIAGHTDAAIDECAVLAGPHRQLLGLEKRRRGRARAHRVA
ncbi:MAG: hypothetical protein JOZ65_06455 [Chloroflexi bacterium]|nr:hypothetical protein [Chloroflexota bacterium]